MNSKHIKSTFYYSIIAILGLLFLIFGVSFQHDGVIFLRLIRAGLGLMAVGVIFLLITLKIQSNEKNDKNLQKFNNATFDERNQFIAGKSASITIDIMTVSSLLGCCVFYFFGMNIYGNIIAGYIVISSILKIGVSRYLRHKF